MHRLIALDLPGGDEFVAALRQVWDDGDAALPLDQRLPLQLRRRLVEELDPEVVVGPTEREVRRGARPVEEDDALVVATSGTTGAPKGVVLTHRAVRASAVATSERLGVGDGDKWLACLPLAHVGGLGVVTRSLVLGTRLEVLPGFDVELVTAAARRGATLVSLVATALGRIDPMLFRRIVLGGAQPPAIVPPNVVTTYGMTETGSGVVYDGRPLDGVEVEVDSTGAIRVRGPMLLRAYRDGTVPTDEAGWFHTGDLGGWDDVGRLRVDGRAGDLIISGGENIWPGPIEAVLRARPEIDDVVVLGEDDEEWGQQVVAIVVGTPPTLDVVRGWVRDELPPFCAPRRLIVVDSIPRTALGKPRLAELRARLAAVAPPAP